MEVEPAEDLSLAFGQALEQDLLVVLIAIIRVCRLEIDFVE